MLSLFDRKESVNVQDSSTASVVTSMLARSSNGVVMLAPGIAQRIIDELNFPRQRPIDKTRVASRLLLIRSGHWSSAFPITFARLPDGTLWLIDGQHRLKAIAEHQVSMPVRIIIHDASNDAQVTALFTGFDRIDSVRTTEQMLNAANLSGRVKLSKQVTTALYRAVPLLMLGLQSLKGRWSDEESVAARQVEAKMDEVLEWQKEASAYERDISNADLYIKRKLLGAGCMAVALYTYRYQPERAREFWSGVAANDGLRKNDARARLIADMMERRLNSGLSRQTVFQPMLAWNAWNEGRELKIIKIAENTRLNLWGTPLEVK